MKKKVKVQKKVSEVLKIRKGLMGLKKRKPKFTQKNWFRHKRVGEGWRKPKGRHSKMREKRGGRPKTPTIGYGTPQVIRGLHPSGYEDILVHNVSELNLLDPEKQACRFAGSLGKKKKEEFAKIANEKGVKILNK